jgi:hypothetical protein
MGRTSRKKSGAASPATTEEANSQHAMDVTIAAIDERNDLHLRREHRVNSNHHHHSRVWNHASIRVDSSPPSAQLSWRLQEINS